MPKVSLLHCKEYEIRLLKDTIRQSLSNIGFNLDTLKKARVVVKPNLLMPSKDEKAIITHSEFFRAAVQIVKESGGTPILLESPAVHSLERTIKKTSYARVVDSEKIEIANPAKTRTLRFDKAKKFKHIDIAEGYFDADIILALPKFKTHGITYITGGVKLLFGAIPGVEKSKMHLRAQTPEAFSEFLLDLYGAMTYGFSPSKPIIHIMDAICAQEGEGPGPAGKPKWLNAVLASENGIAMDYVASQIAGVDVKKALTVVNGFKRDYGVSSPDEIEVIGASMDEMRAQDFEAATGGSVFSNMFRWPFNTPTFKNLFLDRPAPSEEKCTLCYQCKKICASGAISESSGKRKIPTYDYNTCVRCYCCLEICPEAAIRKERGMLQWVLGG
ncbi:MAG: hypothetical protein COX19_14010 [Desulfobacterales bacterium CG23_combo_of_CG06-09_8_20_14_all_51_8]|nr:MAG: hypothetical protein COX19_14010 [Desulfobacterales bacterium CG23_combo_of_CG06-09_8_20_14_all_51_8]